MFFFFTASSQRGSDFLFFLSEMVSFLSEKEEDDNSLSPLSSFFPFRVSKTLLPLHSLVTSF